MEERNTSGSFLTVEPPFADHETQDLTIEENSLNLHPEEHLQILILSTLIAIVAPIGLAGNTVVVWLLAFRTQRNPFSVYILNLAVADCLFFCIVIVFFLIFFIQYFEHVIFSSIVTDTLSTMILVSYFTSMSLLSAIGLERCLSILCPIWYRCRRPSYTSAVTCTLLWALSLMLIFMTWIYCEVSRNWCLSFDIFLSAWLIFLFVVLCVSSVVLLMKVFFGSRRRKMTRLIVTILSSVFVCLLCGLPYGTFWLIFEDGYAVTSFLPLFLSCINSSANPIIYFFVGSFRQRQRRLRQTLRMVLQRALQDTPEGEEPGGAPPQGGLEHTESSVV